MVLVTTRSGSCMIPLTINKIISQITYQVRFLWQGVSFRHCSEKVSFEEGFKRQMQLAWIRDPYGKKEN